MGNQSVLGSLDIAAASLVAAVEDLNKNKTSTVHDHLEIVYQQLRKVADFLAKMNGEDVPNIAFFDVCRNLEEVFRMPNSKDTRESALWMTASLVSDMKPKIAAIIAMDIINEELESMAGVLKKVNTTPNGDVN